MRRPLFENYSSPFQLFLLISVVCTSLLVVMILGILAGLPFFGKDLILSGIDFGNLQDPGIIGVLKYFQVLSQIGIFIIPPIVFAFLVNSSITNYLKIDNKSKILFFLGAAVLMPVGLPFIQWLLEFNAKMVFPDWLSGLENWMKEKEQSAENLTRAFLETKSTGGFTINILMIAILPAIGEELFFRGIVLRIFREWTKNIQAAVWISAILFSAIHIQFYGFLPRLLLGAILGYLFVWTGSLWIPIFAHFINNAIAIIAEYLISKEIIQTGYSNLGSSENTFIIILSFLLIMGLLTFFYLKRTKEKE